MTRDEIFRRLAQVLAAHYGADEARLTEDTRFREDLWADSLDTIELSLLVEEAFEIPIDDRDAVEQCVTLRDVVDLIRAKLALVM